MACCYRMYDGGMSSELTRLTVNLIPKAAAALDEAVELSGDSRTDTINRAVQAYAFMLKAHQGGGFYVRQGPGGELFRVEFL